MSGHSKWSQIKHKKALTDAKRGKVFSKLAREISVAAKVGGGNPDMNVRLRSAIERARTFGLPKDNIERAVQKAAGADNPEDLHEFIYEALGPGGSSIIIEGISDNKNRTLGEVKIILNSLGGKLAEQGSLSWNFEKVGMIEVSDSIAPNPEKTEEIIIESGAEDFKKTESGWLIETHFGDLEKVRKNLEKAGLKIAAVGHDFKPKSETNLSAEHKEAIEKLVETLHDQDDVQEVYTNLATSDK